MKTNKVVIKLNVKQEWNCAKGHNPHKTGSGEHDSRPKRERTRMDVKRRILKEENDG